MDLTFEGLFLQTLTLSGVRPGLAMVTATVHIPRSLAYPARPGNDSQSKQHAESKARVTPWSPHVTSRPRHRTRALRLRAARGRGNAPHRRVRLRRRESRRPAALGGARCRHHALSTREGRAV